MVRDHELLGITTVAIGEVEGRGRGVGGVIEKYVRPPSVL